MKNIFTFFLISFLSLSISVSYAASNYSNSDFEKAIKSEIQKNKKIAACTPMEDNTMKIIGVKSGKCHYYSGFYVDASNKKYPMLDCKVPLATLESYYSKVNAQLEQGKLIYDSSQDTLKSYCTKMHGQIKTAPGITMSY